MSVSVLTRGYDNDRSGANTQESVLTAAAVRSHGIRRLFSLALPGDRRGAEAQPLIVPGVALPGGRSRDLVLLATMANQVFAFDANDGTPLWERSLGRPIDSSSQIDDHPINDHWGILSTPVVDSVAGVLYACAWVSPSGSYTNAQHWLHALSIVNGQAVHPPLNLEGATYDPGHGQPVQRFASATRKQRASLMLARGTVFTAFGSVFETSRDSRGWIIAIDTGAWRVSAAWAGAARGFGAGIWQAGSGPAADRDGFIYCMTGNGTFDAVTDWSESFLRLQYTPPTGGRAGAITVVDWWTPWTDDGRSGLDPSGDEYTIPTPSNRRIYTIDHNAGWDDMDLGSGGPVLIQDLGFVVGAGKDGILYVVKTGDMGKTQPGTSTIPPATMPNSRPRRSGSPFFLDHRSAPHQITSRPSTSISSSAPITSTQRRSIGAAPSTAICCSAGAKTAICAPGVSSAMAWRPISPAVPSSPRPSRASSSAACPVA